MAILESLLWLSLNIYHEARSEDKIAQIAVAHVTLNRSRPVKVSVLKPYAFSWTHQKTSYFPTDIPAYFDSLHSAYLALQGTDFTGGANHYHRIKVKPKWRSKLTYIGTIGEHVFYKPLVKIKASKKKVKLCQVY